MRVVPKDTFDAFDAAEACLLGLCILASTPRSLQSAARRRRPARCLACSAPLLAHLSRAPGRRRRQLASLHSQCALWMMCDSKEPTFAATAAGFLRSSWPEASRCATQTRTWCLVTWDAEVLQAIAAAPSPRLASRTSLAAPRIRFWRALDSLDCPDWAIETAG